MVEGTAARRAALNILRRVRQGHTFANAHAVAVEGLNQPDRRLAHEIAAGVLRRRTELDGRLRTFVSGSWRATAPDLKDLLRIGAYQVTALDRVPNHAAVQATVEVAKHEQGMRAAGLINAVLRKVAGQANGPARRQADPDQSDARITSPVRELATRFSHPMWLVERWVANYGRKQAEALLQFNNQRRPLVIQPARWTADQLCAAFGRRGIDLEPVSGNLGLILGAQHAAQIRNLPGFREGGFVVQDPSQSRLLTFSKIPDGARVWDACASPGGKAAILGQRCNVIASDARRARMSLLVDTLGRAAPEVGVAVADAQTPPFAAGTVDVVLLDAPCSATGTLARHPDGRWRLSEKVIIQQTELQAALLRGVSRVVRPGGWLIYLTCSLEPEENRNQVDRFVTKEPDFELEDDLALFPPTDGTDGGYVARLRRTE